MNPFLPFFIAFLIATAAVWIAAYWPISPVDTTDEVMCELPEVRQ